MSQRLLLGLFSLALLLAPLAVGNWLAAAPLAKQPAEGETTEAPAAEAPPAEQPAEQPVAEDPTSTEPAPAQGEATPGETEPAETEATDVESPAPETDPAPAEGQPSDPTADAGAAEQAQAQFEEVFGRWRTLLQQMGAKREMYFYAAEEDIPAIKAEFEAMIVQGEALLAELRQAGIQAYRTAPNENRQVSSFLFQLLSDDMTRSRYEQAAPLAQLLIDNEYDQKAIFNIAGISYFMLNDYDKSQQYLEQAEQLGSISPMGSEYLGRIDEVRELWAAELAIRQAEAEADDLPRVKLETSEGDIVIELFEDQAFNTVGNFVHLVEQGTYNGTPFHRVIADFMAQGGDPNGDGTGGPGYRIYDEHLQDDARNHFRGSVSMANTGQPNSGGSQFFLCFTPQYGLNGKHTVFGRVIEGMDVLARIQRVDPDAQQSLPIEPTVILNAEVLRKRDHEYVPRQVQ